MKSVSSLADIKYMRRCLALASKATGRTSPNPHVGCVVVKNNKIIAEGYHHKAGLPHGEIEALSKIKFKAQGATLYCNLEPCYHHGRTPPCVDRVIASGIKRVVIAHRDPNPKVAGKSVQKMKKAGIEVIEGICEEEARFLNRFFLTWITKKRPYVIAKVGVSLDGMMVAVVRRAHDPWGTRGAEPSSVVRRPYITSPTSRKDVHLLRSHVDAILVGINTILADDPQLNVRGIKNARQPIRVILDRQGRLPKTAKVLHSKGGELWRYSKSISQTLTHLASRNITSLLVEGGYQVLQSFLKSKVVDEIWIYVSPQMIGKSPTPSVWPLFNKFTKSFEVLELAFCGPDLKLSLVRK